MTFRDLRAGDKIYAWTTRDCRILELTIDSLFNPKDYEPQVECYDSENNDQGTWHLNHGDIDKTISMGTTCDILWIVSTDRAQVEKVLGYQHKESRKIETRSDILNVLSDALSDASIYSIRDCTIMIADLDDIIDQANEAYSEEVYIRDLSPEELRERAQSAGFTSVSKYTDWVESKRLIAEHAVRYRCHKLIDEFNISKEEWITLNRSRHNYCYDFDYEDCKTTTETFNMED